MNLEEEVKEVKFRQLIFEALIHLGEAKKENPRNVLNWIVDRSGNFYYHYEANSIFFWSDKNENDFIKLTDNEEVKYFWPDSEKPQSPDDINDAIEYYNMLITDHMTYAPSITSTIYIETSEVK